MRTGAAKKHMKLSIDGRVIREFEIELAEERARILGLRRPGGLPRQDTAHRGRRRQERIRDALDAITQADDVPDSRHVYHEANRPQFHFTSRRGWLNDPNGLVWQAGEYHLFYQHNPYGWNWGNMHWGHAVSPDLVHWKELPTALYPRQFGDWCFSGSAVVDAHNTGGFQTGSRAAARRGLHQHRPGRVHRLQQRPRAGPGRNTRAIPWSSTRAAIPSWSGTSPQALDHGRLRRGRRASRASPSTLRPTSSNWTFESRIDGFFECPDLFELPVDGDRRKGTGGCCTPPTASTSLGDFDGRAFHSTSGKDKHQLWYGNFYAAQTFSNTPDRRRIQIGWANGVTFPGMPFNQQMALPVRADLAHRRRRPAAVRRAGRGIEPRCAARNTNGPT